MAKKHILLVEDNEGDILLTTEALEENGFDHELSVIKDGGEALEFLFKTGKHQHAKTPDLIFLDINIPKRNGHEILQLIKEDERTRHIPVVMLTTSSSKNDISQAYDNHANCYLIKPVDATEFSQIMNCLESFWFNIVTLPEVNKR